jgi:hypothetical protein
MARPVAKSGPTKGKAASIKKKKAIEEEKIPQKKVTKTEKVKKEKTPEKKTKKKDEKKRGRPVGVTYSVPEKVQDKITDYYSDLESEMKDLRLSVNKFVDYATKSAIKVARQHCMNITKLCKEFRVVLQESKGKVEMEVE